MERRCVCGSVTHLDRCGACKHVKLLFRRFGNSLKRGKNFGENKHLLPKCPCKSGEPSQTSETCLIPCAAPSARLSPPISRHPVLNLNSTSLTPDTQPFISATAVLLFLLAATANATANVTDAAVDAGVATAEKECKGKSGGPGAWTPCTLDEVHLGPPFTSSRWRRPCMWDASACKDRICEATTR